MISELNKSKKRVIKIGILGAILSLALTELRLTSFFGLGELLILLSISLYLLSIFYQKLFIKLSYLPINFVFFLFVSLFFGFITVLFFFPEIKVPKYYDELIRASIAYVFVIINALMISSLITDKSVLIYLLKNVLSFFSITMLVSILLNFNSFSISLFSNIRFFGFAKNPNQLASLAIVIPFSYLYLFKEKQLSYFLGIFSSIIFLIILFVIKSDALLYSLALCLFVYALLLFKDFSFNKKLIALIISALVLAGTLNEGIKFIVENNDAGGQNGVRYILWLNAYRGFLQSPFFGFGPGSFSGLIRPFQGHEAHNTFLDFLTNSGLLGFVVFVTFLFKLFLKLFLKKEIQLFLLIISMLVFSIFHNILRHPLFWVLLFSIYSFLKIHKKNASINYNSSL